MILIKKIKLLLTNALFNKQIYVVVKTSEDMAVGSVQTIGSSSAQWNLSFLLEKEESCKKIMVEVWDYNSTVMIGNHSVNRLGLGDKNQSSYNGFIGSGHQEIKLYIDYQIVSNGMAGKVDRIKAKQTKRTESTNRQSNNSLTHFIEQPSSIKQYQSLIHSISQRNVGQFNPKMAILESNSISKIFSPKVTHYKHRNLI